MNKLNTKEKKSADTRLSEVLKSAGGNSAKDQRFPSVDRLLAQIDLKCEDRGLAA